MSKRKREKNNQRIILLVLLFFPFFFSDNADEHVTKDNFSRITTTAVGHVNLCIGGPPPYINILSPKQGAVLHNTIIIIANITQSENITNFNLSFYYSNATLRRIFIGSDYYDGNSLFNVTWNISGLQDGNFNYRIYVVGQSNQTDCKVFHEDSKESLTIDQFFIEPIFDKYQNNFTFNFSKFINWSNLSNVTVGVPDIGIINFSDDGLNFDGMDINSEINFSYNFIRINLSCQLCFQDKKIVLKLFGLNFTNPKIIRNKEDCPSTICSIISYSNGALTFNITSFSNYSSDEGPPLPEAPVTSAPSAGGGGGGGEGGGGVAPRALKRLAAFTIDRDIIKISARQGETIRKSFKISNTGEMPLNFNIDLSDLEKFIQVSDGISEQSFKLNPNEIKPIQLIFSIPSNIEPGTYSGEVLVKGDSTEKIVKVFIEIESASPLFDVDIEVLSQYQKVFPGNEVVAEITLYNLRGPKGVDVKVEYSIKYLNGSIIITEHETLAVETRANFVRSLRLPANIKPGSYVIYTKVTYNGFIGSSSDLFEVIESKPEIQVSPKYFFAFSNLGTALFLLVMTVFIIIFVLTLIELVHHHHRKKRVKIAKSDEISKQEYIELSDIAKVKKPETRQIKIKNFEMKERLKKRLRLLQESYEAGYISESSYKKVHKKIKKLLENLER